MKQAVIDIGSNSMRLTVYHVKQENFQILFREKQMAGLAGYVEKGALSEDGIRCACDGLLEFRKTLRSLHIENVVVFATASLRNISNSDEAAEEIKERTGFHVEIISGEEEAAFGYMGAMKELNLSGGAFVDIGGASTEIVTFQNQNMLSSVSLPIGSLNLYRKCVKKILPSANGVRRIQEEITSQLEEEKKIQFSQQEVVACVGGTARAVLKFAKKKYHLPQQCNEVTAQQFHEIVEMLCKADKAATDFILKLEPDRIHTIIPGMLILEEIVRRFAADKILISRYGVREGYLCQKVLQKKDIPTHKTEN